MFMFAYVVYILSSLQTVVHVWIEVLKNIHKYIQSLWHDR